MSDIYIVRHGETEWNVLGRKQGLGDSPLTAAGRAHARAVGRRLRAELEGRGPVRIESSPLGRARRTAEIICAELGLESTDIVEAPLLAEHSLGDWQGLTNQEVDARWPGERARREADRWSYVVPGGESYALIFERAKAWLAEPRAGITVAVSHEMMSRVLCGAYARLERAEMLARGHPHDRVYRLRDGRAEELAC